MTNAAAQHAPKCPNRSIGSQGANIRERDGGDWSTSAIAAASSVTSARSSSRKDRRNPLGTRPAQYAVRCIPFLRVPSSNAMRFRQAGGLMPYPRDRAVCKSSLRRRASQAAPGSLDEPLPPPPLRLPQLHDARPFSAYVSNRWPVSSTGRPSRRPGSSQAGTK
jgi:hypothetical protein